MPVQTPSLPKGDQAENAALVARLRTRLYTEAED